MARIDIKKMERVEKEQDRIHEEARATYTTFFQDGKKYFQIDTYGRPLSRYTRKDKPNNSN